MFGRPRPTALRAITPPQPVAGACMAIYGGSGARLTLFIRAQHAYLWPMPMPWTYRHATKDWRAFLADARERLKLESDNMAYTAVQGVLLTFRRRLAPAQVAAFAQVLPAVLRALFIDGWNPDKAPLPFAPRAELDAEARALRRHHNLTPEAPIEPVAWALRRCVDQRALDRVLAEMSAPARDFWAVEASDPAELERRIV